MAIESLSLTVPVPCIVGRFGEKLDTFQTQVNSADVVNLLGHDPRSKKWKQLPANLQEVYEYLQRATNKERREGTARYIEDRIYDGYTIGAFPAISIGVSNPAQYQAYGERFQGIRTGVGEIEFDLSAANPRILLDGLARVTGALDLIDEGKKDVASCFYFPVTIYAPSAKMGRISLQELGQLFHDFNFLQTPVSAGQAIDLDQSNIYIRLTNDLGKIPVISENGGVEPRARSLGGKSTALVAKQVLLRFVRGACEGLSFQHTLRDMPDDQPNLTRATFDYLKVRIERFLTEIAKRMGKNRFTDRHSMLLTSPGWNALGVIFHDMEFVLKGRLSSALEADIFNRIAGIDWSRRNPHWIGSLGEPALEDEKVLGKLFGGQAAILKLVDYIRNESGLGAHLEALKAEKQRVEQTADALA
jgi:hypothetical protein